MDSKGGEISLVFIIVFIIFSVGLVSANHCFENPGSCENSGYYTVMHLSSDTNAHGEVYDQLQYTDWYVCCSFDGKNICDGYNKVIGLSSATNAHAQIPSMNTYTNDVCFGNLVCASFPPSTMCGMVEAASYPYFMFWLSSNTNAHISATTEWNQPTPPPTGYDVVICCGADLPRSCGNGMLDLDETCDDENTVSGDGCSYPDCQIEPGCQCLTGEPNCCWCTPNSHWYLNGIEQSEIPNYFGIRNNDVLTMRFDEDFCMAPGTTRNFQIREGTTTRASSTATVSSSGYTEASLTVTPAFMNALGIGHSDIFFRMIEPWYSAVYSSYIIEVIPKYCANGECSPEDGETCSNCPQDCDICPGVCDNDGVIDPGETCENCPADVGPCCGNGVINPGETCSNCPADVGPCCGNNIINNGEDCDNGNLNGRDCTDALGDNNAIGTLTCFPSGTPNQCQFDASGCSIPGVCTINNAAWSATEVDAETYVDLNIETSNCNNGEEITFIVKESDGFLNPDDPVTNEPSPATINGNAATGSWRAEWQDDTDGGQENPPEYTFTATITSNNEKMDSSNLLIVNEVDVACIGINYCNDYKNESDCTNDECSVKDDSFSPGFCGAFFNPETRCMDLTNCSCSWNTATSTCEAGWNREHLCGSCGNGVTDFGEQCDDGNNIPGDGCTNCIFDNNINPPCPYGTTLCSDLTCSKNCYSTDTDIAACIIDGNCNVGIEGCTCLDCQGSVDTCAAGLTCNIFNAACCNSASDGVCDPECSYVDPDCNTGYCGDGYMNTGEQCDDGNNVDNDGCSSTCELEILTPSCCPEGTAECTDNTCSLNCYATDTSIIQISPNCCSPLVFSIPDQACCNNIADGYCNPYCHYVDPDCIVIPPEDLSSGLCTYTDITTDTCDDYILFRSLASNWDWAVGNNYITNPTSDYWWDAECNGGAGCYRYDPLNYLGTLREHEECAPVQDTIACPDQIKINFFGVYSLIAAIILIIFIYLIFFSRKKKKAQRKK